MTTNPHPTKATRARRLNRARDLLIERGFTSGHRHAARRRVTEYGEAQ